MRLIWGNHKAIYFSRNIWTTQISLKGFMKFDFARKLLEVSAMLPGGISGGPIVNDRYQVIAIAHRGGNQEHKQLAIDVSELLALASA